MARGVGWYLVGSVVLVVLIALAGCSHYLLADREPWRADAEISCLNSGAVKESQTRVRISAINGPGMCGMSYPLRVSSLGDSAPLGYDDEPLRPPASIPNASMPQRWPGVQSSALPPPQPAPPQPPPQTTTPPQYGQPQYGQPQYGPPPARVQQAGPGAPGAPMSLYPPGVPEPDDDEDIPGGPPNPYYGQPKNQPPVARPQPSPSQPYPMHPAPPPGTAEERPFGSDPVPPLGPSNGAMVTGSAGPVELKPAATLACPLVSALDKWIGTAVQPAALHWFRQPVIEIKQISAYSCRGMNGNPNAHISEHAFGNALDIAEFDLADGHRVVVQYAWHGSPEEQGFLHDVQGAACQDFTTVLAPGANVYHYNHIHVDLMRRRGRPFICEPAAIPGEVVAERARARYAAAHGGDGVTGSIKRDTVRHSPRHALGYSGEDDDRLPLAVPGDD
jgi:Extensin-like protein C-terminus